MNKLKDYVLLHVIIFLWGFTGIIGKLLSQEAIIIVWYRLIIASLGILMYILWFKKPIKLKGKQAVLSMLVGLVVSLHWITFYYAIQISTASLGILCLATTTVHVVWLEPLILKTPFHWRKLLFSFLVVIGVAFVARDYEGQILLAVIIGLISAFLAALFSVSNAKLSQSIETPVLSLYELFSGWIVLSIFLISLNTPFSNFEVSFTDFMWLLFLGWVCTSFAFLSAINLVKKLGAFTVALSINLEPVYTMILAVILLSEHKVLSFEFYLSALIILGVLILNGMSEKRLQEKN